MDILDGFEELDEITALKAKLAEVTRERDELKAKLEQFEKTYGVTGAIEDWFERGFY